MEAVPTRSPRARAVLAWIPGMESDAPERRLRFALAGRFLNSDGWISDIWIRKPSPAADQISVMRMMPGLVIYVELILETRQRFSAV
jgi:hypothetical protein